MCANKRFLTTLLRDTWGFDGIVVSDCQAISNELSPGHNYTNNITSAVALSIRAGTDTDCGAGGTYAEEYRDYIQAAMAEGLLSEADLDTAVYASSKPHSSSASFSGTTRYLRNG